MTEQGFWDKHPQPWTYYKAATTSPRYVVTDLRHGEVFETTDEQIAAVVCNIANNVKLSTSDADRIQMFPITVAKQSVGLEPLHRSASGITQA